MSFKKILILSLFIWPLLPTKTGIPLTEGRALDLPKLLPGFILVAWFVKKIIKKERFHFYWNKTTQTLLLFIFVQFLSVYFSENLPISLYLWIGYIITLYSIFFIISDEIESFDDSKKILNFIAYSMVILGLLSCLEQYMKTDIFWSLRNAQSQIRTIEDMMYSHSRTGLDAALYATSAWRSGGPNGGPIQFGQIFALGIFIFVYKFIAAKNKLFVFLCILIVFLGLLFTQSRGPILGVALTLLVSILIYPLKAYIKYISGFFIGSFSAILILPTIIDFRFLASSFGGIAEYATQSRYLSIVGSIPIMMEKPFLGHGLGAIVMNRLWGVGELAYFPTVYVGTFPLYYTTLLESGVFAALLIILLSVFPLFMLWREYRKEPNNERKGAIFAVFLSILSYSLACAPSHQIETNFLFFALLAVGQQMVGAKRIAIKA